MAQNKNKSFEKSLERIEKIVETLENEEVSLQESVKLYKEGIELLGYCQTQLAQSEGEVVTLMQTLSGQWEQTPFVSEEE